MKTATAAAATAVLSLVLVGCSNRADDASREGAEGEPTDHAAPEKAPPGPATKNWDVSATAPAPVAIGAEGRAEVRLTGRNGYHVNQEYPIELTLETPAGAKLAKTKLVRADARTFEEAQAVFPVLVVPESAGRKTIRGELNFSVCNPQNCLLERAPVTVDVEAVAAGEPSPPTH